MKKINVFYSWQSDIKKVHTEIRKALAKVNSLFTDDDLELIIDNATRDTSGSPDISQSIFNKINNSDIFICDITTINSQCNCIRKTANPNVLIELGYAAGILGWDRILLVFNNDNGKFLTDRPFDIHCRRTIQFSFNKNDLLGSLKMAINSILEKKPIKPMDIYDNNPDGIKHKRDVLNIRSAMSCIHFPTMDEFIEKYPAYIIDKIFHYHDGFNQILSDSSFTIYDSKAKKYLFDFYIIWQKSLSLSSCYKYINHSIFKFDGDYSIYKKLEPIQIELKQKLLKLVKYINKNFLEINLKDTSDEALEDYNRIETRFSNAFNNLK
jgi:hypothetical protein